MTRHGSALAALAVAALIAASRFPSAQPATVAITNVSVIPMDRDVVLSDQTVVVRGDTIVAMGAASATTVPAGAVRVDGTGRFLMPAIAEMHGHIPPGTPEQVPDAAIETVLRQYVAGGIGTVRGMLGHPRHLAFRDRAASGEIVSPIIYTSGPSLNGNSAATPDLARAAVTAQKAAGYDLLKIHPGIPLDAFEALAATASTAGIRFSGHVPVALGLIRALELKYETIDHLDGYVEALAGKIGQPSEFFGVNMAADIDERRIPDLVAKTRAAGTWMVPTEALIANVIGSITVAELTARPEIAKYATPQQVAAWTKTKETLAAKYPGAERERVAAARRRLIRELHAAGVPFLLGSDAPQMWNIPGPSTHRELQAIVAAGLTPFQALQTGTVNVARFFKKDATSGTIAVKKRADLLLVAGNPLKNIAETMNIVGVMIGGRYFAQSDLVK
jgi:imidazolonepropionase-like amidohydrolase